MIYVFLVDTGTMMTFEMNLALENVSVLKEVVERATKVSPDKQVLLISGGEALEPSRRLCHYSAGTDTSPIFLFSKATIEGQDPPSPSVDYGATTDLKDQVEGALNMPASYNTVVARAQLAQQIHEHTRDHTRSCQQLVHDQHLQQQGWAAVVANLEDIISAFRSRFESFESAFHEYLQNRDHKFGVLENFEEDLKLLARIPVLPELLGVGAKGEQESSKLTTSATAAAKESDGGKDEKTEADQEGVGGKQKSGEGEEEGRKTVFLLEWISAKDSDNDVNNIAEMCHRGLSQINENLLRKVEEEVLAVIGQADRPEMKVIKGLSERLCGLEQLMHDAQMVVTEQNNFAQALLQNQQRAGKVNDPSIFPDLCTSHRKNLMYMLKNFQKVQDIKRRCIKAKEELSENLHVRLKWIMYIEKKIWELHGRLHMHQENVRRLCSVLQVVEQIHRAPSLYMAAVQEVARRSNFSQHFMAWANRLSGESGEVWRREVESRRDFLQAFNQHFLWALFPGLEDFPPDFATRPPPAFDITLPKVSEADIERLRTEVPELSSLVVRTIGAVPSLLQPPLRDEMEGEVEGFEKVDKSGLEVETSAMEIGDSEVRTKNKHRFSDTADTKHIKLETSPTDIHASKKRLSGSHERQAEKRLSGSHERQAEKRLSGSHEGPTEKRLSGSHERQTEKRLSGSHEPQAEKRLSGSHERQAEKRLSGSHELKTEHQEGMESLQKWPTEPQELQTSQEKRVAESQKRIADSQRTPQSLELKCGESQKKRQSDESKGEELSGGESQKKRHAESQRMTPLTPDSQGLIQRQLFDSQTSPESLRTPEFVTAEFYIEDPMLGETHRGEDWGALQRSLGGAQEQVSTLRTQLGTLRSKVEEEGASYVSLVSNMSSRVLPLLAQIQKDQEAELATLRTNHQTTVAQLRERIELQTHQLSDAQREVEMYQEQLRRQQETLQLTNAENEEARRVLEDDRREEVKRLNLEHQVELAEMKQKWEEDEADRQNNLIAMMEKVEGLEEALRETERSREKLEETFTSKLQGGISEEKEKIVRILESSFSERQNAAMRHLKQEMLDEHHTEVQRIMKEHEESVARAIEAAQADSESERERERDRERGEEEGRRKGEREEWEREKERELAQRERDLEDRGREEQTERENSLRQQYKLEMESLRSRFKIMTTTAGSSMEKSPSLTSLEKVERGELIDSETHEAILVRVREEMKREREEALEGERREWEMERERVKDEERRRIEAEKQTVFNQAIRSVTQDKERVMEDLRLRVELLTDELEKMRRKSTTSGDLSESVVVTSLSTENDALKMRCDSLQKEIIRLETEVFRVKRLSFTTERPPTVEQLTGSVSDPNDLVKLQQENQDLKDKLTRSATTLVERGKITVTSCQPGETVMVIWDENHIHYRVLLEGNPHLHFLHTDSYTTLRLSKESPQRLYCPAEVISKEFCQAKKDENRFRVPRGTKFYRVMARPWEDESTFRRMGESTSSTASKMDFSSLPPPQE